MFWLSFGWFYTIVLNFGFFTLGTPGNPSKIATSSKFLHRFWESRKLKLNHVVPRGIQQHPTGTRMPSGSTMFHHLKKNGIDTCQLSKYGGESKPMIQKDSRAERSMRLQKSTATKFSCERCERQQQQNFPILVDSAT